MTLESADNEMNIGADREFKLLVRRTWKWELSPIEKGADN